MRQSGCWGSQIDCFTWALNPTRYLCGRAPLSNGQRRPIGGISILTSQVVTQALSREREEHAFQQTEYPRFSGCDSSIVASGGKTCVSAELSARLDIVSTAVWDPTSIERLRTIQEDQPTQEDDMRAQLCNPEKRRRSGLRER
jgi:hypothetical protein